MKKNQEPNFMINMIELLEEVRRVDFEHIFQPLSKEELVDREKERFSKILSKCIKNPDGLYSCKKNIVIRGFSFEKLPVKFKDVGRNFYCNNNQLTSLEGAPEKVGGSFYCISNQLTSLEGAPKEVGGYFDCRDNQLTSLEGAPKEVGGDFDCSDNQLTSLEGAPEKVGGNFDCSINPISVEELKKTVDRDYL